MKIALIRHFQVIHPHKMFMSSNEFRKWVEGYNVAETKENIVNIDKSQWQICYSSDLQRAINTATTVYGREIVTTNLLREIEISPFFNTVIKLPFILWNILGRSAWFFSHKSQNEKYLDTKRRVHDFISEILIIKNNNILIVSHGALMWYIKKELLLRGFSGPNFIKAKNGCIYVFEDIDIIN
jgi:Fructose-2,6-bisphosphatase